MGQSGSENEKWVKLFLSSEDCKSSNASEIP